jgi:hypothetical protein
VHLLETFIRNLIEDARYRKPQAYKEPLHGRDNGAGINVLGLREVMLKN